MREYKRYEERDNVRHIKGVLMEYELIKRNVEID